MGADGLTKTCRRDFCTRLVPACALSCFGLQHLLASEATADDPVPSGTEHKFRKVMAQEITHERWMHQKHDKYIGILKHLEKDVGKERLLNMLEKASYEDNVALGKRLSARIPSLDVFAEPFRNEASNFAHTFVREIVEDSEKAFEIRITECLTEAVFRDADARDLGYACVCHADFGLPVGINPRLRLIRSQTLMQGHDCCNHRYVWDG